jgi:hypothetical protein
VFRVDISMMLGIIKKTAEVVQNDCSTSTDDFILFLATRLLSPSRRVSSFSFFMLRRFSFLSWYSFLMAGVNVSVGLVGRLSCCDR